MMEHLSSPSHAHTHHPPRALLPLLPTHIPVSSLYNECYYPIDVYTQTYCDRYSRERSRFNSGIATDTIEPPDHSVVHHQNTCGGHQPYMHSSCIPVHSYMVEVSGMRLPEHVGGRKCMWFPAAVLAQLRPEQLGGTVKAYIPQLRTRRMLSPLEHASGDSMVSL